MSSDRQSGGAELFDTKFVPDDAAYWDALAVRVASRAERSTASAFDWFSRSRAGVVAASLLVAAALILVLMPAARTVSDDWNAPLAPADGLARAIMSPDRPPPIGALLVSISRVERE